MCVNPTYVCNFLWMRMNPVYNIYVPNLFTKSYKISCFLWHDLWKSHSKYFQRFSPSWKAEIVQYQLVLLDFNNIKNEAWKITVVSSFFYSRQKVLIHVFIYEDLMLRFNYSIKNESFLPKSIIFVVITLHLQNLLKLFY